jgi:hypothetical protein
MTYPVAPSTLVRPARRVQFVVRRADRRSRTFLAFLLPGGSSCESESQLAISTFDATAPAGHAGTTMFFISRLPRILVPARPLTTDSRRVTTRKA